MYGSLGVCPLIRLTLHMQMRMQKSNAMVMVFNRPESIDLRAKISERQCTKSVGHAVGLKENSSQYEAKSNFV